MGSSFDALITRWALNPHPEGGWYREVQRSPIIVTRPDGEQRSALTTVLFLLGSGDVSRWHRVLGGDEVWMFLDGAPLSLWTHPHGSKTSTQQHLSREAPVHCVPANVWMAARSLGLFTLVSCCVGPGFTFEDFVLLREQDESTWPAGIEPEFL